MSGGLFFLFFMFFSSFVCFWPRAQARARAPPGSGPGPRLGPWFPQARKPEKPRKKQKTKNNPPETMGRGAGSLLGIDFSFFCFFLF